MKTKSIVLGGGCFWCLEAVFVRLRGVLKCQSGYAGGETENPKYSDVCKGTTGHAEVVKIEFDSSEINLKDILDVFFAIHDPSTLNRQGNDIGTQYRSVIFYNLEDEKGVLDYVGNLKEQVNGSSKITTEVILNSRFYPAEIEHERYYDKNPSAPYCAFVIAPKVEKLIEKFSQIVIDKY